MLFYQTVKRTIFFQIHYRYIKIDFEKAITNASKNVLGEHLIINGCFYHLCQSTRRKLAELGLKKREDYDFNAFCGMLDGLARGC